jgi:hypothetical protein
MSIIDFIKNNSRFGTKAHKINYKVKVKVKVKQSRYRTGVAQRVPGS